MKSPAGLAYTDIGEASTTSDRASYGRYLTPQHEVGGSFGYTDTDMTSSAASTARRWARSTSSTSTAAR